MSFGGPPPAMAPPSGPFEATLSKIASSPYSLAIAMFLINVGNRFLPLEITKGQEAFLNQPWFRRIIIFIIFFLATRNFVTAFWLTSVVVLCVGYLFNENSSLCIFGKGGLRSDSSCKDKGMKESLSLSQEEKAILKALQERLAKITELEKGVEPVKATSKSSEQYQKVLRGLWGQ